jgi:chromosome segregation ATPase
MLSRASIATVLFAATLVAAGPAPSQEVDLLTPAPESVAGQLDRLNRTLTRIAELLERHIEGQRQEVSLKRLELATRRVETLESELARARSDLTSLEDNGYFVRSELETLASQAERSDPESLPALEDQVQETERTLRLVEERVKQRVQRILELENELTRRRQDLEALQDRLDRELEGL